MARTSGFIRLHHRIPTATYVQVAYTSIPSLYQPWEPCGTIVQLRGYLIQDPATVWKVKEKKYRPWGTGLKVQ